MRKEIAERIRETVAEKVNGDVELVDIKKNNGKVFTAISIRMDDYFAPAIRIDNLIDKIESGALTYDEVASHIIFISEGTLRHKYQFKPEDILTRENIEKNVIPCLVNAEKNKDMLKEHPHKNILDLAVIYKIVIEKTAVGMSSVTITDSMLELVGLTFEELNAAAIRNTEGNYRTIGMMEILTEAYGLDDVSPEIEFDTVIQSEPMRVLTNDTGLFGASVLLHPKYLEEVANQLDSDFYIIPSSVNEVIAVTEEFIDDPAEYNQFIKQVNIIDVPETDVLSNHMYKYIKDTGELTIV